MINEEESESGGYEAHRRRQEEEYKRAYAEWVAQLSAKDLEFLKDAAAPAIDHYRHQGVTLEDLPTSMLAEAVMDAPIPEEGDVEFRQWVRISEAGDALHGILEWLTAGGDACVVRGFRGEWEMVWDADGLQARPAKERKAERLAKLLALRAMVISWVLSPQLWDGQTEAALAARIGVTRSVFSHYVVQFGKRFGVHTRGMKSLLSREVYSQAQMGNANRRNGRRKSGTVARKQQQKKETEGNN